MTPDAIQTKRSTVQWGELASADVFGREHGVAGSTLRFFYGRRKDALNILFFDGTGMVIFYERFDSSVVALPSDAPPGTKQIELDDAPRTGDGTTQLHALFLMIAKVWSSQRRPALPVAPTSLPFVATIR